MAIRWHLFAIANYILSTGYVFLFVMAIKFLLNNKEQHQEGVFEFFLITFSMLITILNAVLNIYIFHKHIPDKPLSARIRTLHLISTILFILAFGFILTSLFPVVKGELRSAESSSSAYFLTVIFSLTVILGGFILINQLSLKNYIRKTNRLSVDKMIDEIGRKED